jgi:hypothetical protein
MNYLKGMFSKSQKLVLQRENQAIELIRANEDEIAKYEKRRLDELGDPEMHLSPLDLYAPDLKVIGINQKRFIANGQLTKIPLSSLTTKPTSFLNNREYFRLAYIRLVWVPNATDLPGIAKMGILDERAIEGHQVIGFDSHESKTMHMFTYQQDVYIHKSEFKYFSVFVKLEGFEEKYKINMNLGTVVVYWWLQLTNKPTQYTNFKSHTESVPKTIMPSVKQLSKSQSLRLPELRALNEQTEEEALPRVTIHRKRLSVDGDSDIRSVDVHDKFLHKLCEEKLKQVELNEIEECSNTVKTEQELLFSKTSRIDL